jgi:threonine dehydrogenase-like Zn-dependent dehydrogenase
LNERQGVRALVLGGPQQARIEEFERSPLPPGAIRIEVEAAGVCGSDRHIYHGTKAFGHPVILGHEIVGRVTEITPEANHQIRTVGGGLSVGLRVAVVPGFGACKQCYVCKHLLARPALCKARPVYGFLSSVDPPHLLGGFAEEMVILPDSWVYALPDDLPVERAVLTEPLSVAMRAVERALPPGLPSAGEGLGFGHSAVVLGVGPIGLLAVATLSTMGVDPLVAADRVTSRLDLALRLGATDALSIDELSAKDRLAAVLSLTDGAGADLAVECAGVPAAFEEALDLVRIGGTVAEVGHYYDTGTVEINPSVVCYRELTIVGSTAFPPTQFGPAITLLGRSSLPLEDLVTNRVPLERAGEALRSLDAQETIKEIILPGL